MLEISIFKLNETLKMAISPFFFRKKGEIGVQGSL